MAHLFFGLLALGFAAYALSCMKSGVVTAYKLVINRSAQPGAFKVGVAWVWFVAALLLFVAIFAPKPS